MRTTLASLLCTLLLAPAIGAAQWFNVSFSADIMQQGPQQPAFKGTMYVGEGRLRTEMQIGDQGRAQIIDPESGLAWILNPDQRTYFEVPVPPQALQMLGAGSSGSPCASASNLRCEKKGEESINNRNAVRWRASGVNPQGQPLEATVWTDAEYGFPVKTRVKGRIVSEMRYLGEERVLGRQTEKWERQIIAPDGEQFTVYQWYDPELEIAIRKEMPGGVVRELRNIRIGEQSDALFEVPKGYRQIQPPAASADDPNSRRRAP